MKQILLLAFLLTTITSAQQLQPDAQNIMQKTDNSFFIENKGQWDSQVRYLTKLNGLFTWITDSGVVYGYYKRERNYTQDDLMELPPNEQMDYEREHTDFLSQVVRVKYVNCSPEAGDERLDKKPGHHNYYIGDVSRHAEFVGLFGEVRVNELYEGIDIRYYFDEGLLRYDYKAAPNADISQIQMEIEGADAVTVNAEGELVMQTKFGEVVHGKLLAYQKQWYGMKPVECGFVKNTDGTVTVNAAEYDRQKALVIDPLVYSTYLGGTGASEIRAVGMTSGGDYVAAGTTWDATFPVTGGTFNGNSDAFITQIDAGGTTLDYSSFYGGTGYEVVRGLTVFNDPNDGREKVGFCGNSVTPSALPLPDYDFTTAGATLNGAFLVVVATQNGNIGYSMILDGDGYDAAERITNDDTNQRLLLLGATGSTDLPISGSYNAGGDVYVQVIPYSSPGDAKGLYIGGVNSDNPTGIALRESTGNIFIALQCYEGGLPNTSGGVQPNHSAGVNYDGAVLKLDPGNPLGGTPPSVLAGTYYGGTDDEYLTGIEIEQSTGDIYTGGYTLGATLPTVNPFQAVNNGLSEGIFLKLSNDLSTCYFASYFGGSGNDHVFSYTVKGGNRPVLFGRTNSTDIPVTLSADQSSNAGGYDNLIAVFTSDGSKLTYCSYFGGTGNEYGYKVDDVAGGYIMGGATTSTTDYPVTATTYQGTNAGSQNGFITVMDITEEAVVSLISPNGGETFSGGTTENITWSSAGITNVDIEYSTDNGSNWNPVASGVNATTGSYGWSVPVLYSPICLVRITDASDPGVTDVSSSVFTIDNRNITVTLPNGGEVWKATTSKTITWTSGGVTNVKIEYTVNDGVAWTELTPSTPSDGSYEWNPIPADLSSNCRVRITDVSDGTLTDESDGNFTILMPIVLLTAPNNTVTWQSGTTQTITWNNAGVTTVNLDYTTDDGTTWNSIASSLANSPSSYSWTVPSVYSTQCRVRVSDADAPAYKDASDNLFTIDNRSIAVTYPNGSDIFKTTTTETITWTSSNVTNVAIDYTSDGGSSWLPIAATTPSDGSYDWTVPVANSAICRVRIRDADNGGMSDQSDNLFLIVEPILSVTAPDGGQSWRSGSVQQITWTATFVADLIIEYSSDNGSNWNVISNSYPAGSGTYDWTVPSVYSTECLVRITDKDAPTYSDVSNSEFTIDNRGVTVTAPNGGESWEADEKENITWTAEGVSNVKIEYSSDNGSNWNTVVNSIDATTGSFLWTVPNITSSLCLVRITDVTDAGITGVSGSVFEIYIPGVTVTKPNGGETYRAVTTEKITWSSVGIDNIKLEYSLDNGSTWTLIDPSVAGSLGTYDWAVPNVESSTALIRLSDELAPAVNDVSNAVFTIEKPTITINYSTGWNIISAPWLLDDPNPANVFPTKISEAFAYSFGYYASVNLQPALGFWIKFPGSGSETVIGHGYSDSTVQVVPGWNLIGTPQYDVTVADIVPTPAGIITSDFFEYLGSYSPVATLQGGVGYWVKVSQAGELLLPRQEVTKVEPLFTPEENWITITVSDAAGNSQQLYVAETSGNFELPPLPPNEIFDARFGDDSYLCTEDALSKLRFQSEDYPLTISVTGGNLKLTDGATGTIINRQLLDGESMTITNKHIGNLNINTVEIPADYVLYQNYPNPFNPATTIKFGLPQSGKVEIVVYDQLGQKVETLISEELEAGYHEFEWNAMQYSSGVYFYTINAGNFKSVKKMLLLK